MQYKSIRTLVAVVALFFFTSSLTGSFLPIYFRDQGLNLAQICAIMLLTFITLGFLPVTLLRTVKDFERMITVGILTTMLFFIALVFVKSPVILGLAYGVSLATFWPSFNLLLFRLSESNTRARTISLYSSIIPSLTGVAGPAAGGIIIQTIGYPAALSRPGCGSLSRQAQPGSGYPGFCHAFAGILLQCKKSKIPSDRAATKDR